MKKKAEDLKPGDVLPANAAYGKRVVCAIGASEQWEDRIAIRVFNVESGTLDTRIDCLDSELEVESSALTPAQQHAEELASFARRALLALGPGMAEEGRELLARIDPPKPPSAEELASMLDLILDSTRHVMPTADGMQAASRLVERARAAGMLS